MDRTTLAQALSSRLQPRNLLNPRGVSLSEAGKTFLNDCREILERLDQASDRTKRVARGQAGVLRIGMSEPSAMNAALQNTIQNMATQAGTDLTSLETLPAEARGQDLPCQPAQDRQSQDKPIDDDTDPGLA